jgi:23S rRNA (pseudouridine1915-N3)-methyltransferase
LRFDVVGLVLLASFATFVVKGFWSSTPIPVKLTIAWIGKTKNSAIQSLADEYLKRLRQCAEAEGVSLKDEVALLKLCGRDGKGARRRLVLLDSSGKQLSSEELAGFLGDHLDRNPIPLVFAIGAADGFSETARQQADFTLSLGKMTIAHELARVVLLEQLYRGFTILKGHPYHLGH